MTHGVATEGLDVKIIGFRGENEESDHSQIRPRRFQIVIQSGQGFYEDISTLVAEFVSTSDEEVQGLVQVEVVVSASTQREIQRKQVASSTTAKRGEERRR